MSGTGQKIRCDITRPPHVPYWKPVSIITAKGERLHGHFEPTVPIVNQWNGSR